MLELIKTYTKSCIMAEQRIKYLTVKLNELKRNGGEDTEEYTDLQRRIRLLYIERTEMPRRVTLNSELGATDRRLRKLLEESESESADKIKRNLVKIIKNELTSRQSQIIMLYYFKEMNINEIAQTLDISPAAVSVTMKRARNKLFNILKYIIYSNAIK